MGNLSYRDTARHYCVDDLPGASVIGGRLQKILECLRDGQPITRLSLEFLQQQRLDALHRLASGALTYDLFRGLGLAEQARRVAAHSAAQQAREAEKRAREAAAQARMKSSRERTEAARLARESDPKYILKINNQRLRIRYGIDTFVEQRCFNRLMAILRSVDAGYRISEEDFVWLSSVAKDYFSDQLRDAYHWLEASFFACAFEETGDPWMAVNASSHYRKCNCARDADALLDTINVEQQRSPKLQSALCTTHGGVMRDLGQWDDALRLGRQAHAINPDDYRPCTLLGAIHMEIGNYGLGQEWYAMAVERGATVKSVDQDLRQVFCRADQAKQAEMAAFLLSQDPIRFAWVQGGKVDRTRREWR